MASRFHFQLALPHPAHAASLRDTCSLIVHSASTSHRTVPRDERLAIGIADGLVRLPVEIKAVEHLTHDFGQALAFEQERHRLIGSSVHLSIGPSGHLLIGSPDHRII
jgi:cystathionine beta-lyase/cystathionine gamma-synthase